MATAVFVLVALVVIASPPAKGRGVSRALVDGATQPFKTAVYYDTSLDSLTDQQQMLVKEVLVRGATRWLSDVLKVRPLTKNVTFERSCVDEEYYYVHENQAFCRGACHPSVMCGPVEIPTDHLRGCRSCSDDGLSCETGEDGDGVSVNEGHFVLYVSAVNDQKCSSRRGVFVDSAHCLQEDEYDRPIAAYLNFCPFALSTDSAHFTTQLHLVLKELLHTLAFSEKLFPFYHNEQGYPRTSRDNDGKPVQHLDGLYSVDANTLRVIQKLPWTTINGDADHTVHVIGTPNVLREAREHFNCPTMRGVELEDQGGVGVALNHWEKRLFGDELMTASLSSQPVISRITLALLEDSGWYIPDYHYASVLPWGTGCAFVNDSCSGWMNWTEEQRIPSNPFCDGLDYRKGRMGCVDGRTAVGPCFARNYTTDLPLEYQYLSRKRGGSLSLYDYCPVYSMVTYGAYRVGQSCLNPDHAPSSNMSVSLEVYGSGSRCFDQSEPFVRRDQDGNEVRAETYGAGCYQYRCSGHRIFISVGGNEYRCRLKGQKKTVVIREDGVTYTGKLICPGYEEVCAAYDCLNQCSDHGTCLEGVCYCHPGFYGDDCSQSHAQILLSCDDVECQNGAQCNDSGGYGFVCSCPEGYTGAFCEREIYKDPCVGVTCSGRGYCTPTRGGLVAQCNCYRGWGGTACRRVVDFCEESGYPCGDGGQCVANTTTCLCKPNRTGRQCELIVDLCLANPCLNGGSCTSHFDNQTVTCECTSKYEGEFCEQEYSDPCTLDPCQNGANCTRLNSTDFECDCPRGWIGPLCNLEDKCLDLPCENGGTCVNIELSFVCICPRGYTGQKCRHLEDPCADNPCQHGGTCRQVMNAPRGTIECDCLPDFYGEYCDIVRIRPVGYDAS